MGLILTEVNDRIGTITFNNAEKRNCLNSELLQEFMAALDEFEKQKALAVIIRAAKGSKVWSAGLDISELPQPGKDPLSYGDPLEKMLRKVEKFPAPVIAMIEGSVWGGACDLAFVCDIIIGAPNASFAITPAKIGVPYNSSGIIHFINVVGMHIAKEMFFTAQPVAAERALQIGIMNHLVPTEKLEGFTYDMAKKITRNSPLSISVVKEQLRILGSSHPLSPESFERIQALRTLVYESEDYQEGKEAFRQKRRPVFKGR